MGVQKHLFVIERGVIKELLKLKTNARSFTKIIFYCKLRRNNHVHLEANIIFRRVSRVQEFFVGNR